MTDVLDTHTAVRDVLAAEATALVRLNARSVAQRERLERAAAEAVQRLGCDINDVAEATGLSAEDIRRAIEAEPLRAMDDLDSLAGVV